MSDSMVEPVTPRMPNGYVYCLTDLTNGKFYIGQTTKDYRVRFAEHLQNSRSGKTKLHKAIREHGKRNFLVEVLAECTASDQISLSRSLGELERLWIAVTNARDPAFGYNSRPGGDGGPLTPAAKQRHAEAISFRQAVSRSRAMLSTRVGGLDS